MLTRRNALATGAATIAAATPLRFARAAEFTFKWGTNVPETHPLNVHARDAIAQLTKETNGRVDLQLFANNTLGGDSDGFRQVTTSTRPIHTPDDFKGLKIRVPISALWTSLFQSLGASPTSINFAEVYSALQTKVVDAEENPPAIISAAKLYEVQKYCSLTNQMWDGWWLLMNRNAWASMPPDLQQIFARVVNAAAVAERVDIEAQNQALKDQLAAKGLVFNDVDPAPFRAKLTASSFYKTWKEKFGPEEWGLLEQSTGPLG